MTVRASRNYKNAQVLVGRANNLYAQHARDEMNHALGRDVCFKGCSIAVQGKRVSTLDEFLDNYNGHVRKQAGKARYAFGLAGPAASELEVHLDVEEEGDASSAQALHVDLTNEQIKLATPKKKAQQAQNPRRPRRRSLLCSGLG